MPDPPEFWQVVRLVRSGEYLSCHWCSIPVRGTDLWCRYAREQRCARFSGLSYKRFQRRDVASTLDYL